MRRAPILSRLALLAAVACDQAPPQALVPVEEPPEVVQGTPGGEGQIVPGVTRARRRMDIDQLDAALKQVSGGIGWTTPNGAVEGNYFTQLALTLGKPDFLGVTEEDLSATPLFSKFLDDAARSVCKRLLEREVVAEPSARVFLGAVELGDDMDSAPEAVEANLARLLLRFHSRKVELGGDLLVPWRELFAAAHATAGETRLAWQTVCVGLVSHPDFYTY